MWVFCHQMEVLSGYLQAGCLLPDERKLGDASCKISVVQWKESVASFISNLVPRRYQLLDESRPVLCQMLVARCWLHHQCIRRAVVVEQWQVNYSARGSYTSSLIIGEQKNQRQPGFYWLQGTPPTWHTESWSAFFSCHKLSELLVVTRNLDRAMETYLKI